MVIFRFKGQSIEVIKQAYLDCDSFGDPIYIAPAEDEEGGEYLIYWLPYDNFKEIENEDEMCNWQRPYKIERINIK
jgi:hypothetical protein